VILAIAYNSIYPSFTPFTLCSAHIFIHTDAHMRACMHVCMHTCTRYTHKLHTHKHTHTHTHTTHTNTYKLQTLHTQTTHTTHRFRLTLGQVYQHQFSMVPHQDQYRHFAAVQPAGPADQLGASTLSRTCHQLYVTNMGYCM